MALATWSAPLRRHVDALQAARPGLLTIQLGGPIGNRSSLANLGEVVARGLADALDLAVAEPGQAARDRIVGFAALAGLITGTLGKIGADVALMAQNEVVQRDFGEAAVHPHWRTSRIR